MNSEYLMIYESSTHRKETHHVTGTSKEIHQADEDGSGIQVEYYGGGGRGRPAETGQGRGV